MGVLDDLAESVQESKKPTSSTSSVWSGGGGLESAASSSSSSSSSKPSATSSGAGSVSSASTGGLNTALSSGGGSTSSAIPDVYSSNGNASSGAGALGGETSDPGKADSSFSSWVTDFASSTKSGGSYTLPPPPMAELDPNASYPPPGYSSYNMAGSGSTGNGASAKDNAALVGALGLALAGGAGNGAGAAGAGTVAPNVDSIGSGSDPDSDVAWASFNNWLALQKPPVAADGLGYGPNDDSEMGWVSFQNWLATQQPPGELTSRSVKTVPIDPNTGQPVATQGDLTASGSARAGNGRDVSSGVAFEQVGTKDNFQRAVDYLISFLGGGEYNPYPWDGDTSDNKPPSVVEAEQKAAAAATTDPNWAAFQDAMHLVEQLPSEDVDKPMPPMLDPSREVNPDGSVSDIIDPSVPLPKPRPEPPSGGAEVDPNADMQWEPAVVGETTPLDENEKANGDPWQQLRFGEEPVPTEGAVTGSAEGPAEEPSAYDKVVDNAGKLLSHTGLGALVSTLFPDLWNAGGDMMKGLDDGGMGSFGGLTSVDIQNIVNDQVYSNNRPKPGVAPPEEEPPVVPPATDFPDVNNNGIDDRLEPPGSVIPAPVWDQYGQVVFPGPGYKPGLHDEWMYFRQKMAEGGVVGYADGGEVSPLAEPDPRIQVIADAEDALENMAAGAPEKDDAQAIKTFVDQFGAETLRQLQANVAEGAKMRPKRGPRMVLGPGGPKDDAIPAVIDGTQPAALSSGEFVWPAEAVAGAGEGDPVKGAKALQELSEALASRAA